MLQVVWVRPHDGVELGELAGTEEDFRQAELEVQIVQTFMLGTFHITTTS